jgi:hypothetical protein
VCSYYDIGAAHRPAWSYRQAYTQVKRVSDLISFEPDEITAELDGKQLHLEPGQTVISHGVDRDLTLDELSNGGQPGHLKSRPSHVSDVELAKIMAGGHSAIELMLDDRHLA